MARSCPARVRHNQFRAAMVPRHGYGHGRPGVAQGIADQVVGHPAKSIGVAGHNHGAVGLQAYRK